VPIPGDNETLEYALQLSAFTTVVVPAQGKKDISKQAGILKEEI
jgi:hypothetical protein